jgi:hypothetical protein
LLRNHRDLHPYFERNAHRLRYPEFRKQGLFVGSGVIEAGCKTVIGSRLKRSGMFWTVRDARILSLLCRAPSSAPDGITSIKKNYKATSHHTLPTLHAIMHNRKFVSL